MQNANTSGDSLVKIIPFEKEFHLAPLCEITPDAIKEAASQARNKYRDRAELKHNTALNYIARRLGFKDGFAGYQKEGQARLIEFMQEHGLKQRVDLIRPRSHMEFVKLTPRNLGDRLFSLGDQLPDRVFTGYNVDWFEINDRHFRHNPWCEHPAFNNFTLPNDVVMAEVARANTAQPGSGDVILEAAIAACESSVRSIANLLGDVLFSGNGKSSNGLTVVPKLYRPNDFSPEHFHAEKKRFRDVANIFQDWMEKQKDGWVRVIPFNERLIFLAVQNGDYDFLFPGQRDELFNHNPHAPYLKNGDVPKSNDSYHFKRWIYFEYEGWLEKDQHESEIKYYELRGEPKQIPDPEALLKKHLELKGTYIPPTKTAPASEGFIPVVAGNRLMHVSNLVTMEQFHQFMRENTHYAAYSRELGDVDPWEQVNNAPDQSLPAVVTWYDANAYASWISRAKNLPVRLLTEEEYLQVACAGSDLEFLALPDFGEWLNEDAAAINTATKESLCNPGYTATKGRFSPRSNGSYKSKRVGFRLCYLGEVPATKPMSSTTK
jgi:hypothetical protein